MIFPQPASGAEQAVFDAGGDRVRMGGDVGRQAGVDLSPHGHDVLDEQGIVEKRVLGRLDIRPQGRIGGEPLRSALRSPPSARARQGWAGSRISASVAVIVVTILSATIPSSQRGTQRDEFASTLARMKSLLASNAVSARRSRAPAPSGSGPGPIRSPAGCRRPGAAGTALRPATTERPSASAIRSRGKARTTSGTTTAPVRATPPGVVGVAEPIGDPLRGIDLDQLFRQHLGGQEVVGDEPSERAGDAGLVARHDPGVGDRQSQRPAEQRHHREPVGAGADHAGFGERPHIGEPFPPRLRERGRRRTPRVIATSSSVAIMRMRRRSLTRGSSAERSVGAGLDMATSAPPWMPPHHLRSCRLRAASSA